MAIIKRDHLDREAESKEFFARGEDEIDAVTDQWSRSIEHDSVYSAASEFTYLTGAADADGHPEDGIDEATVGELSSSSINVDSYVSRLRSMDDATRQAHLTIWHAAADVMKQRYPKMYDQDLAPIAAKLV